MYNVVKNLKAELVGIFVFKYFKSCHREEELGLFATELVPKGVNIEVISFRIKNKQKNPSNQLKQDFQAGRLGQISNFSIYLPCHHSQFNAFGSFWF